MSDPRYPVGPFVNRTSLDTEERQSLIGDIAATPQRLRDAVAGLDDTQLDTPYRDGGWTLRQVVHHVPDSHLNAYTRLKLALTEDTPVIRPYDEALWANLPDVQATPVETSLMLLETLHARWVGLMRAMAPEDFARPLRHPDHDGPKSIDWIVALYSWHGRHHVAHITSTRERLGW
ncbi:MAG TPA: putative metal-dependent hydrolase [Thermoanaerobaculia bacterium]|jgi:uncharacterized damage-inducible protein DinB